MTCFVFNLLSLMPRSKWKLDVTISNQVCCLFLCVLSFSYTFRCFFRLIKYRLVSFQTTQASFRNFYKGDKNGLTNPGGSCTFQIFSFIGNFKKKNFNFYNVDKRTERCYLFSDFSNRFLSFLPNFRKAAGVFGKLVFKM